MDNNDEFFQKSRYNVLRGLLIFCGLWPYHTVGRRRAIRFFFLLVVGSGFTLEVYIQQKNLSDYTANHHMRIIGMSVISLYYLVTIIKVIIRN